VISNIFLSPDDLVVRTRWYIYLRWFILLTIIVPGIVSVYIGEGLSNKLWADVFLGLIALSTNVLFYITSLFIRKSTAAKLFTTAMFLIDIALITFFIYTRGGIDSRSVILYVVPLIMSAAFYGRAGVYALALVAMMAYDALLLLNYYGVFY
jgi:hypothetical protein